MRKLITIGGISVALLAIAAIGMRFYTKSFSPAGTAQYEKDDLQLWVDYCRPYKRDREIFGGLIAYNEVWRTGANEATTFHTNKPLMIGGKRLEPGSYSLFTVPGQDAWSVIFNSETGQWGVKLFSGEANRSAENDILSVEVRSIKTNGTFEQFTIAFEEMSDEIDMVLMWDQTLVVVPMIAVK
ncbi:MAG: DUF2911 domain-containing protein [Cytophagales bacterium]|nr:DUF2911 domain-containing protein [Cytophagales bacterium]